MAEIVVGTEEGGKNNFTGYESLRWTKVYCVTDFIASVGFERLEAYEIALPWKGYFVLFQKI